MKILFDQGTPAPLRRALPDDQVMTVYEQGWSTLKNGHLLAVAEQAGFDVFVTTDQNLKYQQTLTGRRLAIVVLSSTSWPRIRAQSEVIRQAIARLAPGDYHEFFVP
jgi:predicted nuclease of predicted toxin-antitoxin system